MTIETIYLPYVLFAVGFAAGSLVLSLFALLGLARIKAKHASALASTEHRANELSSALQQAEVQHAELHTRLESVLELKAEQQVKMLKLEQSVESLLNQRHFVERKSKIAEAQWTERERSFKQQLAQVDEQKQVLKKEFELLANRIFEERGQVLQQQNSQQLASTLDPFKEQIERFQQRVNEVHSESVKSQSQLESQVRHVLDIGLKMSDEAHTLTQALKGDKKAQGNWSEVQAELILQISGLHEGREYRREASFKTEDGKEQRPDFIINLPNDKHVIVDSKISLNAYLKACAAETQTQREQYLREHVDAIRTHIKRLSAKNYPKLSELNSPEYVFMFIGNEPAYLAAAQSDNRLLEDAYRKGVAIVTANTLLSSLRIVAHLWSVDKQNSHTRELAEQASKVYDKLRVFAEKMQKLGNQIGTVQRSYDESWNTLKDGRSSLAKQVDRFVDMGVAVKEKLPNSLTDAD